MGRMGFWSCEFSIFQVIDNAMLIKFVRPANHRFQKMCFICEHRVKTTLLLGIVPDPQLAMRPWLLSPAAALEAALEGDEN